MTCYFLDKNKQNKIKTTISWKLVPKSIAKFDITQITQVILYNWWNCIYYMNYEPQTSFKVGPSVMKRSYDNMVSYSNSGLILLDMF